jgi:predicted DNA-binding transcriptional regulator AlpA
MAKKAKSPTRFLTWDDLRARGVAYHSNHLRRMWGDGRFPKPVHLSPRKLVWDADAVEKWLADKLREHRPS